MTLLLLTATLSLADVGAQATAQPVTIAKDYAYAETEISPAVARGAMAADRQRAQVLGQSDSWYEVLPNPGAPAVESWHLQDVAHLLHGVQDTSQTDSTLAQHIQREHWGDDLWGYESWRSHARMAEGDATQLLYWVKDVRRGRGVWIEERDVLVTFDELGRVQRAYTSARGEGGPDTLTTFAYDAQQRLATVVKLTVSGEGDNSWARKLVMSAE